jgi:hypothetical protein
MTTTDKVEEITTQEERICHVAKNALPAVVPWPVAAASAKLLLDKSSILSFFTY